MVIPHFPYFNADSNLKKKKSKGLIEPKKAVLEQRPLRIFGSLADNSRGGTANMGPTALVTVTPSGT